MAYNYAISVLRVICTNTVQRGIERKAQIMSNGTTAYFVGCIDRRLAKAHHKAIKDLGLEHNCYMHLRAGGAASFGAIFALRKEARLVNASHIILTIHTDCKGCVDAAKRLRNLKANRAAAQKLFPGKKITILNIGLDGTYSRM